MTSRLERRADGPWSWRAAIGYRDISRMMLQVMASLESDVSNRRAHESLLGVPLVCVCRWEGEGSRNARYEPSRSTRQRIWQLGVLEADANSTR